MSKDAELIKVLEGIALERESGVFYLMPSTALLLAASILKTPWGQRVQAQREALEWYYEDDKRQVDNGILEDVAKRPARAALDTEAS